jgi:CHAD domain-containing protein
VVATYREQELKFETPADFVMPAPEELLGRSVRSDRSVVHLESTYFDTEQRSLLRYGVTLRRREGEDDTGWHLKVPAGSARTEIRLPLEAGSSVPDRLATMVAGIAAGKLAPVAIVKTTRRRTRMFDDDQLLIELADDKVVGTVLGAAATVTTWHELEAELGSDDERLLAKVGKRLVDAGASRASAPSKLARTLGWTDPRDSAGSDARGMVLRYLTAQLLELGFGDIAFRRGLDPVHKTRVAGRRFRSVLRVFRHAWRDPAAAGRLDDELSWYQDLLGEVRDRQVLRARLSGLVAGLPDAVVLGPVSATIDENLLSEQMVARDALGAAMDSQRYFDVLRSAEAWATDPPVRSDVDVDELLQMTAKAQRAARKRLKRALAADSPELLHRARKAAKRARYATELSAPAAGKSAGKRVKAYKHAQDALGEHQDSAIAAAALRRLGAVSTAPDQNGFTFGLLYEREQVAAECARQKAHALLGRLP